MSSPTQTNNDNTSSSNGGGCPVKHSPSLTTSSSSSTIQQSSPWGSWFRKQQPQQPQQQSSSSSIKSVNGGSCPIQNGSIQSIEEAAKHAQTPQPDQTIPLSTHRTVSSIPKGNTNDTTTPNPNPPTTANDDAILQSTVTSTKVSSTTTPTHQPVNTSKWVYPSEQQFYNAMKRKGWDIAPGTESTIPFVVQIHNAVNEKGWKEIKEWESLRSPKNDEPKLVKFIGRPKDLSPRARFYSTLWMRNEPFDRHDWFVSREDGSGMRRYVIDFYNGKKELPEQQGGEQVSNANASLPSMYLDVRPALDDPDAACDRMKMFVKDAFPGIASFIFKS